jgi:hypothetical protein
MDKPQPLEARQAKQPYEKPELRKVTLAAGEVAAAGCKSAGGAMGPTFGMCSASMCMSIGS